MKRAYNDIDIYNMKNTSGFKAVRLFALLLMFALFIGALFSVTKFSRPKTFADQPGETQVGTDIFVPDEYIEFKKLYNPIDVCVTDKYFAIAESNRIIIYEDGFFKQFDLDGYNVTKIAIFDHFCIFLSISRLYWFDIYVGTVFVSNDVVISNFFFLSGNTLVTNPSGSAFRYEVSEFEGRLNFSIRTAYSGLNYDANRLTFVNDSLFFFHEGKVIPLDFNNGEGQAILENVGSPRFTASDESNVYYSTETGLYKIDIEKRTCERLIACRTTDTLFNVLDPRGISYFGGYLYVADFAVNAVYKIDLSDNTLTDFAVTDRGDSDNRIDNALDIAVDDAYVYALENTKIKMFERSGGKYYCLSLDGFAGANKMAVSGNYILLSNSSNMYVVERSGENLSSVAIKSDVSEYKNVTSVTAHETAFYFINNESINSVMTACVYALDIPTMTVSPVARFTGVGRLIASDIFGSLYIAVANGGTYDYHVFTPNDARSAFLAFSDENTPKSLFVDIEASVFVLSEDNMIRRFSDSENGYLLSSTYKLALSENLPEDTIVTDACALIGANEVYLLTDSCILTVQENSPLSSDISALTKLAIPDDYKIAVDDSPIFARANKNAKLFVIVPPTLNDDGTTDDLYFTNNAYRSEDTDLEYILIAKTSRYFVLFNRNVCAVIRKGQVETYAPEERLLVGTFYLVDDCSLYAYPYADGYFDTGVRLKENSPVKIEKIISFNQKEYAFISSDDGEGYIPLTFLKADVADASAPTYYYTIKIKKGGANVYSDSALTNKIGSLDEQVTVYALADENGATRIIFGDGEAYIASADITSSTYYSVRNLIVIIALFIGLTTTVVFLLVTKVFRKEKD